MGEMTPRCLMAAKFRCDRDPSGELMLKHWIVIGQIQDRLCLRNKNLKYFKDFKDLSYVASDIEYKALTIVLMLIKTNSRSTW